MTPTEFFDRQFKKQVAEGSFELNPFETLALEHLQGRVLDLGAGLGNLSLEAGRRGHQVLAVEWSATAVARIRRDAASEGLAVEVIEADLSRWEADRAHDTVVAIGLLSFFRRDVALGMLGAMKRHLCPGGKLILNVLIEGTTFMDMFSDREYHLFQEEELEAQFADWEILLSQKDTYAAPNESKKELLTLVIRRPASPG